MKEPRNAADPKALQRFVDRVRRQAHRQFGEDIFVDVYDSAVAQRLQLLAVPHYHLCETNEELLRGAELAIANLRHVCDYTDAWLRHIELAHRDDREMRELEALAKKLWPGFPVAFSTSYSGFDRRSDEVIRRPKQLASLRTDSDSRAGLHKERLAYLHLAAKEMAKPTWRRGITIKEILVTMTSYSMSVYARTNITQEELRRAAAYRETMRDADKAVAEWAAAHGLEKEGISRRELTRMIEFFAKQTLKAYAKKRRSVTRRSVKRG